MKRRKALAVMGAAPLFASLAKSNPSRSDKTMKKEVKTPRAPQAIGPYSQGIISPPFVFCSGQLPADPTSGQIVEGGIEEQTRQVLKNVSAVLEAAGSSLDNVVKSTVFLRDLNDFAAMNKVYAEFFKLPAPARAAFQVVRLPKDVMIEIEAIACL